VKPTYNDLRAFFDLSVDVFVVTSSDEMLVVNPAYLSAFGYTLEEAVGRPWMSLVHPDDRAACAEAAQRVLEGESTVMFEARSILASGEVRWFQWSARADLETGRIYATGRDITNQRIDAERLQRYADLLERTQRELKEAIEELTRVANTDQLTGLMNRRAFELRLAEELSRASRSGKPIAVAMLDVDHFKAVNDEHGHPMGDIVLREVARRLDSARRPYDVLARWGGEEFIAIFPETSADNAKVAAERFALAVSARPMLLGRVPIDVRVSGGVVSADKPQDDDELDLVASADQALRAAKENGRDRIETGTFTSSRSAA
jgi:diguanylate cyclase (GGDEF)-like protein/PAS domain S-box-containing protein